MSLQVPLLDRVAMNNSNISPLPWGSFGYNPDDEEDTDAIASLSEEVTENMDAVMHHLFRQQRRRFPPSYYNRIRFTIMLSLLGKEAPQIPGIEFVEEDEKDIRVILPNDYVPTQAEYDIVYAAYVRKFSNYDTAK